jgi:Protein of unknown function (DUF3606)
MDPVEMQSWCNEIHCSEADLRNAITAVGEHVTAVRDQLALELERSRHSLWGADQLVEKHPVEHVSEHGAAQLPCPKCGSETVQHQPTQFFAKTSKMSDVGCRKEAGEAGASRHRVKNPQ